MTDKMKSSLIHLAKEAAGLDDRNIGDSYAYAFGVISAMLEDQDSSAAQRVEKARLFIREFDQARSERSGDGACDG